MYYVYRQVNGNEWALVDTNETFDPGDFTEPGTQVEFSEDGSSTSTVVLSLPLSIFD